MKLVKIIVNAILMLLLLLINIALGSPRDFSSYVVPSEVEYQLIDPSGNVTGYDPFTKVIVNNILHTKYLLDAEDTPGRPPNKYEKVHRLHSTLISDTVTIPSGTYKVKFFGSSIPEKFTFEFKVYYHNYNGPQAVTELNALIYPSVTWLYELNIPEVPPSTGSLVLTKVASATDFITDITAAGQLGYIGNAKFVNELIKEVQEIEKERTEVRKQDDTEKEHLTPAQRAIKQYKELLKEITEKYQRPEGDEFVKQEAYTVLKEDLDYIIGHIQ